MILFFTIQMLTDGIFLYSSFEGMAKYHKNLVYFFYYDHRNAFSFTDYFGNCSITDLGTGFEVLISVANMLNNSNNL